MSDMGAGRGKRRVVIGIMVAGLVVLALVLAGWTGSQTRWRTYAFPADPKTGVTIVIDYPDGWSLHSRNFGGNGSNAGVKQITFMPQQPTGLVRWWRDHVLRQKLPPHVEPRVELSIWPDSLYKNRGPDQVWKNFGAVRSFRTTRTMYPLGPAMEITAGIDMSARLAAGTSANGASSVFSFHQVTISPDTPLLPPGMRFNLSRLSTGGLFVDLDPQFRGMAHRLRVVQTRTHLK